MRVRSVGMRRMPFLRAFGVWTFVIWVSRLRNIWQDDELDTAGQFGRSALAMTFVVGAVVLAFAAWRATPAALVRTVVVVAVWTIGVWVVRSARIFVGDWSVAFKVVHTVLAVVSIALAAAAIREVRERAGASESPKADALVG